MHISLGAHCASSPMLTWCIPPSFCRGDYSWYSCFASGNHVHPEWLDERASSVEQLGEHRWGAKDPARIFCSGAGPSRESVNAMDSIGLSCGKSLLGTI